MTDSALIFAKRLDGKGGALSYTDIDVAQSEEAPVWFHFDANHPDTKALVAANFKEIDEHSLQALFTQDARPRMLQLDDKAMLILRGINHNEGEEPEDMVAVRLWLMNNRLISLRYRRSKAVMQVAESLDVKTGPKSIGDILTHISAKLFSFIEAGIGKLDDRMDEIEARVIDDPDRNLRHDISEIRKSAIMLRRYIAPQKEAINQLRLAEFSWLGNKHQRRIQESHDSLLRSIEELDTIRERSQVVKDELATALSDKLNRNLYVLSVITAIFLPLGFLTGLFGINIGGMPGVEDDMAFTFFSLTLLALVGIQVVLFRLFKWF